MAVARHLRTLEAAVDGPATLEELAHRTSHAGFGLIVVFVCLPFLQPIPMGGLSTVFGPFVALQGFRMWRGDKEIRMPAWMGKRRIEEKTLRLLLGAAAKCFGVAERFCRPRWRFALASERVAGAGIALAGALLALPFPIPLSNMICAGPATFLALSGLEEDGLMAALGWLGLFLALAFHAGLVLLGGEGIRALLKR